ncbi:MAG: excinuclease ABC subunit UvrA, partial [Patescibacteria group bacterium]
MDYIKIKGARVHNLKNISINIPKNKLVVVTGLSGSGKSSLAFDTIYAEAERRFVESLSSYARQFLGVKEKPEAESITGLSPAIAIDQKSLSRNPRSTVGTITEIYDYLRLLFVGLGRPVCPVCRRLVEKQTVDQMINQIFSRTLNNQITILAPLVVGRKGEHRKIMEEVQKSGFLRVRIDKEIMRTEEALDLKLDPKKAHSIYLVIDRLLIDKETERPRLAESLETALHYGKGICEVEIVGEVGHRMSNKGHPMSLIFSENFACAKCGFSFPKIEPRLFSFNSPYGACSHCDGLGSVLEVDESLVIPNKKLSLAEGAI